MCRSYSKSEDEVGWKGLRPNVSPAAHMMGELGEVSVMKTCLVGSRA